jgi:hypothetical protein
MIRARTWTLPSAMVTWCSHDHLTTVTLNFLVETCPVHVKPCAVSNIDSVDWRGGLCA